MKGIGVAVKPTLFQIREACIKNLCPPQNETFKISRSIQVSAKYEGDSQLGLMIFIGVATEHGYSYSEIAMAEHVNYDEYVYKRSKYKRKLRTKEKRFGVKVKLIKNYLRLRYGVV